MKNLRFTQSYQLPELGISLIVQPDIKIEKWRLENNEGLYQNIGETQDIIFLRYGPNALLEEFPASQSHAFAKLHIIDEWANKWSGQEAKICTYRFEALPIKMNKYTETGQLQESRTPGQEAYFRVMSVNYNNVPILVGFRVATEVFADLSPELDQWMQGALLRIDKTS